MLWLTQIHILGLMHVAKFYRSQSKNEEQTCHHNVSAILQSYNAVYNLSQYDQVISYLDCMEYLFLDKRVFTDNITQVFRPPKAFAVSTIITF